MNEGINRETDFVERAFFSHVCSQPYFFLQSIHSIFRDLNNNQNRQSAFVRREKNIPFLSLQQLLSLYGVTITTTCFH